MGLFIARRPFLTGALASVAGASAAVFPKNANAQLQSGGAILTVTGRIANTNRPKFNEVHDTFFKFMQLNFDKAYAFSASGLGALPRATCKATTKQTGLRRFAGVFLKDVLAKVGADGASNLHFVSLDGYTVDLPAAEADAGWILATTADNETFGIGDFAPVWLIRNSEVEQPTQDEEQKWAFSIFYIEVT
jgi:hypothetical protein